MKGSAMTDQAVGLEGPQIPQQPDRRSPDLIQGTGHAERPARLLLGWVPSEHGEFLLASAASGQLSDAHRERVIKTRQAVASRPEGVDQADLLTPTPLGLAEYLARLEQTPPGAAMLQEGWTVTMVDLTRVVAFQPHVFVDTATERAANLDPDDLPAIAELTLPIDQPTPISVGQDLTRAVFTVTSPNPNVKVAPVIANQSPNGLPCLGYAIQLAPSYLQVVRYQNRHILRDGYHRAYGLLSHGITHAPAFVRDFDTTENLAPAGMLPHHTWLGSRPPTLPDYDNNDVSEPLNFPATRKVIVIQATELSLNGY
jgi:hypothetical protein